jgi:hypothetical protein
LSEKLKFYTITMSLQKEPFIIVDFFRAGTSNIAYEMFVDKHLINKDDVKSYKIVCCGELRDMGHNPYKIGTCAFWVFQTVAKMPIEHTIKIDSVHTRMPVFYCVKSIGQALRKMESDGYLKTDSQNSITGLNGVGEKIYIKYGQVKGV